MFKIIINKITKILVFFILIQPVNADEEKVNKLNQELSHIAKSIKNEIGHIVKFIKNEIEKTKDYQINAWKEAKHKNFKNMNIVQHKLTGFFSDFPGRNND